MQPTVFISRNESRTQGFIDVLKPVSAHITCESLIDFSIIRGGVLPRKGWLFFYSQTGVDFFLEQYQLSEIESKDLRIAAFGRKTGQYIRNQGLKIDFIGTGDATSTADLFLSENDLSHVCFIKGTSSKDSLRALLQNNFTISAIEVYDNRGKQHLDISPSDILVFTSPLNLETYYAHYPIDTNQKVVTIGTTTALSALNLGLVEVHISSKPSLESLAALVIKLCDTWSSTK